MKIIYYSPHPNLNLMSPTGYGTHMREMIAAFRKEGCEVMPVIMGGIENSQQDIFQDNGNGFKKALKKVVAKSIWRSLKDINLINYDRKAAKQLENVINRFHPDCIYERCNYLQMSGIKMAQKYKVKHVLEINSPYIEEKNNLSNSYSYLEHYAKDIEKRQVVETNLALPVVTPLKEYYCQKYNLDCEKFYVVHNAFNKDDISLDKDNQQKIVEKYSLADKLVVGFVGSIFEWHNLDKLIEATAQINQPDIKLFIVGDGAYRTKLVKLVDQKNMDEQVIFTGRVPRSEIFDYINSMDVCVAPGAAWYQSPVKIFEYGAMGKPILGPDTEAVREIMEPGKDGILVDPTVTGTKEGLNKILSDMAYNQEMGHNFQQKILNEYTWKKNAQKILAAIQ